MLSHDYEASKPILKLQRKGRPLSLLTATFLLMRDELQKNPGWKRESEAYEQGSAKTKHRGRNTSNNKIADDVKLHQTVVIRVA